MVLRRSDSAKTTLSMYLTRTSKYQKYLGLNFVILLLGSLTMIFFGVLLKLSYYMDQLDFLSINFALFPWMLIGN